MDFVSHHDDFGRGTAVWHECLAETSDRLVFLGANGHASMTYRFFMRLLSERYSIDSLDCRAVWPDSGAPPQQSADWDIFLGDYLAFLKFRGLDDGSLIHVGHSFGGSLGILLAQKRPDLVKRLVVVEPGTIPTRFLWLVMSMASHSMQMKVPLFKSTLNRRDDFGSHEEFIAWLRTKKLYRSFTDEAMQDYASGGLLEQGDRYKLRFPGAWEAHIFTGLMHAWSIIPKLKVPTLVLRGESTYLQSKKNFLLMKNKCEKSNPNITLRELKGVGHMAIQENPELVSSAVLKWLGEAK